MIKDVSIEIIQKCVNHCIHCSSCSTEECTTMLQLDTIGRVIAGLQRLKVKRVCLSGGEPFLHPDIVKIVKQISNFHIITDIYSCGVIKMADVPKPLSVEMLSEIKKAGLRTLIFNLQSAHEETYDLITQSKNHFPLLCESITNAIKCGIRTEIHFVPMKQNINDAVDVLRFAEQMGVMQVNFLKLVLSFDLKKTMKFELSNDGAQTRTIDINYELPKSAASYFKVDLSKAGKDKDGYKKQIKDRLAKKMYGTDLDIVI